jgi:hypothetical protein
MKLEYSSDFAESPVVHTSNVSICKKKVFSFHVAVNNSIGFLVINICNHGEHYETPRT